MTNFRRFCVTGLCHDFRSVYVNTVDGGGGVQYFGQIGTLRQHCDLKKKVIKRGDYSVTAEFSSSQRGQVFSFPLIQLQ